jgi:metallopeptidase family M12-like protein
MMNLRVICAMAPLCGFLVIPVPVLAQAEQETIPLMMLKPQGAGFGTAYLRKLYAALKKRSTKATSQVLPLTKAEVWTVPKADVEGVRKAAARYGVAMSKLSATWNHIFHKAAADAKMNDRQKMIVDRAKISAATTAVGLMAAPPPPMVEYALTKDAGTPSSAKEAASITVALSDDTTLTIRRESVETKSDMCTWRGIVETTGEPAVLMWWPGGKMAGTVQHEGRFYSIRPMGGEMHAVVEMSDERMPQEHAPISARLRANDPNLRDDPLLREGDASKLRPLTGGMRPPSRGRMDDQKPSSSPKKASADPGAVKRDVVIDVIVAYTKKAASYYADVKRELVDLAIEEANESFRKSNLEQVKLRLVHAYETNYVEDDGEHFQHLWRFADKGDGYMDEIHGLRDKYRADVGVLIVDDASGCGLATRVYADEDEAFAVVHHECAATSYSVAHEIGHIIGARHDLSIDGNMMPFAYGHGYVNGTKWRDIMSYKASCNGCPRLPVWSSPKVLIKGEPAGTPQLDNARVIAEQAARVAAFR